MSWADLYHISIYIIFLWSALYHIVFSPVSCQLEFSSLEGKYNKFRNGDEGTWQKPLVILTTKDRSNSLVIFTTFHVCHRRRAAGRNQQVEEYKHNTQRVHTFKVFRRLMHASKEDNFQSRSWQDGKSIYINISKFYIKLLVWNLYLS